jgi:antitoxin (DNA-binding transcriptional repressor) of toxin-antitoxin stability system
MRRNQEGGDVILCTRGRPVADEDLATVERFAGFLGALSRARAGDRPMSPATRYHLRLLAWRVGRR